MMTVDEWRKRAHACMAASRNTSDRDAQVHWESLAESWLNLCDMWPGSVGRRERRKSNDNGTPVAVAGGDRLRDRLAL
jgi:hypothetical protein